MGRHCERYVTARAEIPWIVAPKAEEDFIVGPGPEGSVQWPRWNPQGPLQISFAPRIVTRVVRVTAIFVGLEQATGGSGSNRETRTHVLHETEKTVLIGSERPLRPGDRVELRHELRVPSDASPTFEARHSSLKWIATISFHLPWGRLGATLPITVMP